MGIASIALFGALGVAVDAGRMYIAKGETQTYCDAASIAAALQLDGTTTGLSRARTAASNVGNTWNFSTTAPTSPTVEFGSSSSGPWSSSPTTATNLTHVRVSATAPVTLYFLRVVVSQQSSNIISSAVAGQIPKTSFSRGLAPYTVVSTNTDPTQNFGLVVGHQYDIQWPQFNGTRAGCSDTNPDRCFNSSPCSGDPLSSQVAVKNYWGSNTNGFWGYNSASSITNEVVDGSQTQTVTVGQLINMASGNMNVEGVALDTRVQQDGDTSHNEYSDYNASSTHNGRRLIALPVVNPTASGTYVTGFASFLLISNGASSNFYTSRNGNEPYCAIYVGPYVQGAGNAGGSSSTGSFIVKLVL